MYFEDLDLNDNVLDALYDMRFDECTPVQEKCIPEILKGHDVLGVAQTEQVKQRLTSFQFSLNWLMVATLSQQLIVSSCRLLAS